jgi:hypothetical protein
MRWIAVLIVLYSGCALERPQVAIQVTHSFQENQTVVKLEVKP